MVQWEEVKRMKIEVRGNQVILDGYVNVVDKRKSNVAFSEGVFQRENCS